jgi:HSP20 family protein
MILNYLTPYQKRKEQLINNFFDDVFTIGLADNRSNNASAIDETDDAYTIRVDVPGFKKSEISVEYDNTILSIHAKSDTNGRHELRFTYTVKSVDIKKSSANLDHGVLTLTLAKASDSKKQFLPLS